MLQKKSIRSNTKVLIKIKYNNVQIINIITLKEFTLKDIQKQTLPTIILATNRSCFQENYLKIFKVELWTPKRRNRLRWIFFIFKKCTTNWRLQHSLSGTEKRPVRNSSKPEWLPCSPWAMQEETSHLSNKESEGCWAPQKCSRLLKVCVDTKEAEHRSFSQRMWLG